MSTIVVIIGAVIGGVMEIQYGVEKPVLFFVLGAVTMALAILAEDVLL